MKKVKVWLARDKDERQYTCLYLDKPAFHEYLEQWHTGSSEEIVMPKHYGLKPGECIPAYLVIGEE